MCAETISAERPEVVAIAAVCANGVIGDGRDQPWRNRDDFARFRRLTMGQVLIMGRRTFDAIGRPLPGRHTIVLTRSTQWAHDGVAIAHSLADAFAVAARRWPTATLFIAGGGEVYRLALPVTDRLELTEVELCPAGEIVFPAWDPADWEIVSREQRAGFAWATYRRRRDDSTA